MPAYTVVSEIQQESGYETKKSSSNENVISTFPFISPPVIPTTDSDGDFILQRKCSPVMQVIEIEHSQSTTLKLVGMQVWRGALLLADFILHKGNEIFENEIGSVLELGSGVGLTGIVAAMNYKKIICTDADLGDILQLISNNVKRNNHLLKGDVAVLELDFQSDWSPDLIEKLKDVTVVLAADVIYDDDITEAFVQTLEKLLTTPPRKTIYVALEKRYVFTIADFNSVAPCYEYFLQCLENCRCQNISKQWSVEQIDIDFPQYFKYDRVKELVLWKITVLNI